MIEYIKGELTELTPAQAVVETGGIGYALNISLNSYTAIQGKKEVKLYVHESLQTGGRDDNYTFYGFATRRERELYRLLITVSGVGANTARTMLSSITPAELCNAIANGDEKLIKSVKGIGLKTSQRIIVDLKDKIMSSGIAEELHVAASTGDNGKYGHPRRSCIGIDYVGLCSCIVGKGGYGYSYRAAGAGSRDGCERGVEENQVKVKE